MEWQENAEWFTDEKLKTYDVIVFLNTTGDILNDNQQAAMQRFIQSGKGFVGIHSASDTEYNWEWYTRLVGRMFVSHPAIQTARLHPSIVSLWVWPIFNLLIGLRMNGIYYLRRNKAVLRICLKLMNHLIFRQPHKGLSTRRHERKAPHILVS